MGVERKCAHEKPAEDICDLYRYLRTDSGSLTFSRQCIAYKFLVRTVSAWLTLLAVSSDMQT